MAKPYREGTTWSFRLRIKRQDIYRSGFATEAAARRELNNLRYQITNEGCPAHDGPWRTNFARALQLYALERLPFRKGARQDADRINRYLRLVGFAVLRIQPVAEESRTREDNRVDKKKTVHFSVALVADSDERSIPRSLSSHRSAQLGRTATSDNRRKQLAMTPMADVEQYQIQGLIDSMQLDDYSPASVGLERALIRQVFNYASSNWRWPMPAKNPAVELTMPKIDNARSRVLSNDEWVRICTALETSRSKHVAPALAVLLETAMRSSEALLRARWGGVDFERCILSLGDAKAGAREVPLSPGAIAILKALQANPRSANPSARVFPITYECLKSAWNRACVRANVMGANVHDLRHTAATRFSLEFHGDMPLLKVITGHKTDSQLQRYVNLSPDDAVRKMHRRPLSEGSAPAGYRPPASAPDQELPSSDVSIDDALPANVIPFARRSA